MNNPLVTLIDPYNDLRSAIVSYGTEAAIQYIQSGKISFEDAGVAFAESLFYAFRNVCPDADSYKVKYYVIDYIQTYDDPMTDDDIGIIYSEICGRRMAERDLNRFYKAFYYLAAQNDHLSNYLILEQTRKIPNSFDKPDDAVGAGQRKGKGKRIAIVVVAIVLFGLASSAITYLAMNASVDTTTQPITSLSAAQQPQGGITSQLTEMPPETHMAESVVTSAPTEFQQSKSEISLTHIIFPLISFPSDQKLSVYSAPSTSSWHAVTSKGDVAYTSTNGDVFVAGNIDGWTLIRYYTGSNKNPGTPRMGYTYGNYGSPLRLDNYTGTITRNCDLSDGTSRIVSLASGTTVTVLGNMDSGIYIETYSDDGRIARGTVPADCVGDVR